MNILRIVGNLYPTFYGGLEIHTHSMSMIQSQMDNNVIVLTCDYDNSHKNIYPTCKIFSYQSWFRIMGNPIAPQLFIDILKFRKKTDVIHAHDPLFLTTNIAAVAKFFCSIPLIITNHGLISQTAPIWLSRLYYLSIGLFTLLSADKIICYTDHDKDDLIQRGINPKSIAVIHNGVNTDVFAPKYKQIKTNTNLLWIGRYTHGKGIHDLINAFALIVKKKQDIHLLMIGNGPLLREIQELIQELRLSNYVTQKSFIPNENLPNVYQSSDVFILPSINEGVPRTILEAMSCGIPVICTELPQLKSIVEECGLLVPIKQPGALAEALWKIICDHEFAKQCGINGRKKVISRFSWEDTVKLTLGLYEEVINMKKEK